MRKLRLLSGSIALVVAVLFVPGLASAATLPVDSSIWKTGYGAPTYSTALPAWAIPGNIVASLVSAFADTQGGAPDFAGTLSSVVYQDPGTGHLLFTYLLTMAGGSTADVLRMTLNGFDNWTVATAVGSDGSGSSGTGDAGAEWTNGDPLSIDRSLNGDVVGVTFKSGGTGAALAGGDTSAVVFFEVDAQNWQVDVAQVIDGSIAKANALVPNVPEPGVLAMLASGIAALGLGLRRRFTS